MTETQWLACRDPELMLQFLRERKPAPSPRKFRLFGCAACRRVQHLVKDERNRQAIAVAERFAEGPASGEELRAAQREVGAVGEAARAALEAAAGSEGISQVIAVARPVGP